MKQRHANRSALALLMAATALPFTPVAAQDSAAPTSIPGPPPVVTIPAPPATVAAPLAPPAPAVDPAETATELDDVSPPPAEARPPTRTRRAHRSTASAPAPAAAEREPAPTATVPAAAPAPAPAPTATAPAAAPATAPLAARPPGTEPAAAPPAAAAAGEPRDANGSAWPWLIGGLLVLAGIAFLFLRRRPAPAETIDTRPAVAAPPVMAAPMIDEGAAAIGSRPELALAMRPVRAGVGDDDAVVEFELTVDNRGSAPARDVRISTWMFPAGKASEAERALIDETAMPAVTIGSGRAKKIETSVALPTAGLSEDSVLPVVVAEAHYRMPDGSEAQARAAFEVGVAIGDELAHFDLENPSGMHEDVVARPHRETAEG